MSIVAAKCTNCGANLEINQNLDAAVCPFCNTAFVVEKAINNYKVSIQNSSVNIYTYDLSYDEKYENANSFLTIHKEYLRSAELFEELVKLDPNDYRGWWGVVRSVTREFSYIGHNEMSKINRYADSAFRVCKDEGVCREIKSLWAPYKTLYDNTHSNYANLSSRKNKLDLDIIEYQNATRGSGFKRILGLLFLAQGVLSIIGTIGWFLASKDGIASIPFAVAFISIGLYLRISEKTARKKAIKNLQDAKTEIEQVKQELIKCEKMINTPIK